MAARMGQCHVPPLGVACWRGGEGFKCSTVALWHCGTLAAFLGGVLCQHAPPYLLSSFVASKLQIEVQLSRSSYHFLSLSLFAVWQTFFD